MAPASTGSDSSSRKAVTSMAQANSGILCSVMPGARMFMMVVMKLIAPRIDDAPARCSDRMPKSSAGPGWPDVESGGYTGQPPPKPVEPGAPSTNSENNSSAREDGSNQNEMLFMRGTAMGGPPIMSGTNQLPTPPMRVGMTRKNTMIRPWPVTNTL